VLNTYVPTRRVVVLLLVTAMSLMALDGGGFGPISGLRQAGQTAAAPIGEAVDWGTDPLADAWQGVSSFDDIQAENEELRRQIAELEGQTGAVSDLQAELAELRNVTGLSFASDLPVLAARVVDDRRGVLERVITVDQGTDEGVVAGMPVVTGAGLIGTVTETTGNTSTVRLINDARVAVGVVSHSVGASGVAKGNGEGEALLVDLFASELGLVEGGERFVTSGVDGGLYPPGIPVGELSLDGIPHLVSYADLDSLGFVSIILTEAAE
jgi:rod shape-determining protein MreC